MNQGQTIKYRNIHFVIMMLLQPYIHNLMTRFHTGTLSSKPFPLSPVSLPLTFVFSLAVTFHKRATYTHHKE